MKKEMAFTIDELYILSNAIACLINESCWDMPEEEDLHDKIYAAIEELEKDSE